jgi:hypothetical protein
MGPKLITDRIHHLHEILKWRKKLLYKECNPEFMPSRCGTVQIGSLKYFRNHYKNEIADKLEGKTFFELPCLGSWLEVSSWLNNTSLGRFGGIFPDYKYPKHWPDDWDIGVGYTFPTPPFSIDEDFVPGWIKFDFGIVKYPENASELVEAVCKAEYTASNAFLFCLKHTAPDPATLQDYTASWRILRSQVLSFAERLATSIASNAEKWSVLAGDEPNARPASEFGTWNVGAVGQNMVQDDGVYVLYAIGDVLYLNATDGIKFSFNYPWAWSKELFFLSPFFKTTDFRDQSETRIVFYLVKKSGKKFVGLNPVEDTVLIPFNDGLADCVVE